MLLLSLLIDWHASAEAIAGACRAKIATYAQRVATIELSRVARTFRSTVLPLENATSELRDALGREMFLSPVCAQNVVQATAQSVAEPQIYAALLAAERSNTATTTTDRKLTIFWIDRSRRAGAALPEPARTEFVKRSGELNVALAQFDADPKSIPTFEHILALRNRLAHLQGYESWADYALADRMAENPMRVEKFLRTSIDTLKPAAAEQEKRVRDHHRHRGEFDPQSTRTYFPRDQTATAIVQIISELLGLQLIPYNLPAWAPNVVTYNLGGAQVAPSTLHLDLRPRAGKSQGLIASPIVSPRYFTRDTGTQAEGAVIGALPDNLTHGDVVALFRATGQSIATLLAATPYESLNTFRGDFDDAPGQMFENFAWQPDVLKRLGLPEDIAAKLIATRGARNAYDMSAELQLALLDQQYHRTAHPRISGDPLAAFDATYYSQAWGHVYAADMFTAFSSGTVLDPAIGARFRQDVLAPAGSLEPDVEVSNFLGRPMNADAFYKEATP